jgi:sulfonate transport system ATP-binding protein
MVSLEENQRSLEETGRTRTVVRLENVEKWFGGKHVLQGISLNIHSAALVAVVGRSGSGKSTLLRLLAGLEAPTKGSVTIVGSRIDATNRSARVDEPRREVRLMFQDAALLPWETVLENVLLAVPKNRNRKEAAYRALRMVGLESRAAEWPTILSGGQRQRIALARALASEAPILLLDEPLGALDALTRLEMQNLVEQIWLHQRFLGFLVTHDVEEAVALADRVLLMEDGRIIAENEINLPRPRDRNSPEFIVLKEYLLESVMAGKSSR